MTAALLLPVHPAGIPSDLVAIPHWVTWRLEHVEERETKVPYVASGARKASSTDPATWASHLACVHAYERGECNGIGFVLTPDDGFIGWDFDKCRDPETGAIDPVVHGYVAALDSYTEISPSGTGLRVIVRGSVPRNAKRGPVECYTDRRFLTITGHALEGAPIAINDRPDACIRIYDLLFPERPEPPVPAQSMPRRLMDLDDQAVLELAQRARNGAKFDQLWSGDTSLHGGDDSAADLALVSMLAFYTQDERQIDRLFRNSGLYRPKWDARHSGDGRTYGQLTIAKALSSGDRYSAPYGAGNDAPPAPSMAPAVKRFPELRPVALKGLAGDVVAACVDHSEGHPVGILATFLAMFGSACGRTPHIMVGDTRHGLNENFVIVGDTSKSRKGTTQDGPMRIMTESDREWAVSRVVGGLSSGEGVIWAVRDPIIKTEPVKDPETGKQVGYRDTVVEPGVDDKRLMVIEEEFSSVLKQTERDGNTLSEILRRMWDARRSIQSLTRNSPTKSTGAHVSIIGHITVEEVLKRLSETEMANGMANRFIWIAVRRERLISMPRPIPDELVNDLAFRVRHALQHARKTSTITFTDAARARWDAIYRELSASRPGLIGSLSARSEAHTLRLALLYALLDEETQVDVPHLEAALALWDYSASSLLYIFGDRTGNDIADRILAALREGGDHSQEEISNLFKRNVPAARIQFALSQLKSLRLADSYPDPDPGHISGRKKTFWKALNETSFISYSSPVDSSRNQDVARLQHTRTHYEENEVDEVLTDARPEQRYDDGELPPIEPDDDEVDDRPVDRPTPLVKPGADCFSSACQALGGCPRRASGHPCREGEQTKGEVA